MKINSIKLKNKNNTNVFVVNTDGGSFELHSESIVKHSIKKGEVEDEIFSSAVAESSILIALEKVTKYLSSKLKTEQQIKDYLYKQGYHKQTVNAVIDKLKEYCIINDENFAKSYINSNPNYSTNKLKQKLISFGVKANIIDEVLLNKDDGEICLKQAQKFLKNKNLAEVKDKLIRHLSGKGYNYETIKSTLNKLNVELEEF